MIVVCTCHPNTARMCKIVSQFRQTCAKQWDSITREDRAGSMVQVVEYLPSKCGAPNSNPVPTIKK
jgi:hypothetical protein